MPTKPNVQRIALWLGLAVAISLPAQAGPIFDSLGAGDTFQGGRFVSVDETPSNGNVGGLGFVDYSDREWAWAFTVASGTTFSSVDVALSFSGENEVDLWIASDAGGSPGAILDLMSLSGAMTAGGSVVSATSTSNPFLTPGTYYFGVSSGLPGVGGFGAGNAIAGLAGIHLNSIGATGTNLTLLDEGTGASPYDTWITSSTGSIAAFRINGTMVPEPASLVLLGTGLLGLGITRRRR